MSDYQKTVNRLERLISASALRGGFARLGVVGCGGCSRVEVFSGHLEGDVRWRAMARGWDIRGGLFFCPECSGPRL